MPARCARPGEGYNRALWRQSVPAIAGITAAREQGDDPMTNLDKCYNIFDLRDAAQRRLPKGIFEYVDKGTEDQISLEENRAAFQRIKLRTRFLNDWSKRDLGTQIFGKRINLPFGIAPTGSSGLMWYRGEVELARAAAAAGIPFTLATGALTSMEELAREVPDARKWFQLYP